MRKTIFITGYGGFIGKNLIEYLDKYIIKGYDLGYNHKDIFDNKLDKEIKNCDIVIHLAALTSVSESFKVPDEYFYTNVLGTAKIVQLCAKYNKKLIFPSSASVFHEDLSPYAESKKMAEDIVRKYKNSVILRFYNIFGPGMNPNSGSIMYNFLTSKELVIYGDGEQTRDFIHVRDIVRIIEDSFKSKWNGKIVDVGTGQSFSVNYVAGLFSHFRNLPLKYKPPKREIKWSIADTTMLKTLYKKKLTTDLEKDIKKLCLN